MSEIRCECNRLLATRKENYFEIKSEHDKIDVAFPFGKVACVCGKVYILNPYTPYIYYLPLEKTIYNIKE